MNYQKIVNSLIYSLPFYTERFCEKIDVINYMFDINNKSLMLTLNTSDFSKCRIGYPITLIFLRKLEALEVGNIGNCLRLKKPETLNRLFIDGIEKSFRQDSDDYILLDENIVFDNNIVIQTIDYVYLSKTVIILNKDNNLNTISVNYGKIITGLEDYSLYKIYINHKVELLADISNINYYIDKKNELKARVFVLPMQSNSSRSIHSISDAITEQNIGSDFIQTRINNFMVMLFLPNDLNSKGGLTMCNIKQFDIPAVIKSLAGLKLGSDYNPISYKQDSLSEFNNGYILYGILFECIELFSKHNIVVSEEFLLSKFNILGDKNND